MHRSSMKVMYLTQCPAPYREKMHELLSGVPGFDYHVVYCTEMEPNRKWKIDYLQYKKTFLQKISKGYRHHNPQIWKLLVSSRPDVIIITGFTPTMLYSVIWATLRGSKLIVYNDGTLQSEKKFSFVHKLIRKFVFLKSSAFVAPGKGTVDLYESYKIPRSKIFRSCLHVDNRRFNSLPASDRKYHIMFSGQIVERKMPLFFAAIAIELKKRIPNLRVLIIGDGDQKEKMTEVLTKANVDFDFPGFLTQQQLPGYYNQAKLFLFPTLQDPWGIVANEACASGTPVITCENAGASDDLVINGYNGFVLPLEIKDWVEKIYSLLSSEMMLQEFSMNAIRQVEGYNTEQSVEGLTSSVQYATTKN